MRDQPARRFTEKPDLDPSAVMVLAPGNAAMRENRSIFPTTVVTVTDHKPDRLLVSGRNNRKLGDVVAKGRFKGYALYGLSLEERATCPTDCDLRGACYGNGMQLARRHKIGDADIFFDRLGLEIVELLDDHAGLLVRLHVLGDFPSVEYVAFWADALNENDRLAVYGYTHRRLTTLGGDEIGDAIHALKGAHPERFRIRWSSPVSQPDGAVVVNVVPRQSRTAEGLVCPAQTDATACCASCGLCWEPSASKDTIVFIKHGRLSDEAAAEHERAKREEITPEPKRAKGLPGKTAAERIDLSGAATSGTRAITPITLPPKLKPATVSVELPKLRLVKPADLLVEATYQRDLSGKSVRLIRRIVEQWDWTKFKPPICAETGDGLFVIDGQHTAIAAASHGGIPEIPVLMVDAAEIEKRAASFVAHNRDRLSMSPLQVFHAEMAAGDAKACKVFAIATAEGATIPRYVPPPVYAKPGQLTPISELRKAFATDGQKAFARLVRILVLAGLAPVPVIAIRAIRKILTSGDFAALAGQADGALAAAVKTINTGKLPLDMRARQHAHQTGLKRDRACALLIAAAAGVSVQAEAA